MLGFADGWITLVYILCILSAVLCAVYGFVNWNRGGDEEAKEIQEELDWQEKDDKEIESKI
jgi:hypothetical protein